MGSILDKVLEAALKGGQEFKKRGGLDGGLSITSMKGVIERMEMDDLS